MNLLRDAVTDYDGHTFDTGRLLIALGCLAMVALATWQVVMNHGVFDAQAFGLGYGGIVGGFGVYAMGDNRRPPLPAATETTQVNITQGQQP